MTDLRGTGCDAVALRRLMVWLRWWSRCLVILFGMLLVPPTAAGSIDANFTTALHHVSAHILPSADTYKSSIRGYDVTLAPVIGDIDSPSHHWGPIARADASMGTSGWVSPGGVAAKTGPDLIRARDVRFTQDSAGATFKDGRSVFDLADEMSAAGGAPSSMPPIRIFEKDGNIHSLDNRRLFAGQYADVSLPYVWASPAEVAARNQTQIFGGTSINIRMGGGVKAWWQP